MNTMPLNKNRTIDNVVNAHLKCEKCERNYQLLDARDFRMQAIIVAKTGRRISMTVINEIYITENRFYDIAKFRF